MQIDLATLEAHLKTRWIGKVKGRPLELWDTIHSTNDRAAALAAEGAPAGMIVVARQQTAGRGRQGRTWVSTPESSLLISFLVRPDCPKSLLPLHTLAAGVASARAIWDCVGLSVGLKWVNDLVVDGRKVGGILAEMPSPQSPVPAAQQARSLPPALVIGIGINLRLSARDLPPELVDRVDWLERLAGQPVEPNLLAAQLAFHLEGLCETIAGDNPQAIVEAWKEQSVTLGREIRAITCGAELAGKAVDITDNGGLVLETADGKRTTLHAGEITIRGINGKYA